MPPMASRHRPLARTIWPAPSRLVVANPGSPPNALCGLAFEAANLSEPERRRYSYNTMGIAPNKGTLLGASDSDFRQVHDST